MRKVIGSFWEGDVSSLYFNDNFYPILKVEMGALEENLYLFWIKGGFFLTRTLVD